MPSRYKPYPKYKDSEVEWLGDVPEEWNIIRLKNRVFLNMGQSPKSEECNQDGIGLPFLQGNAEFGTIFPKAKQFCNTSNKIANSGDILFSVRAPVGEMNIADQHYGIGRGLCSLSITEGDNNYYWWLLIHSKLQLDAVATGSTFEAVSTEQINTVRLNEPPISEQRAIAAFLDHETGKLDELIAKQQDLIALLGEKRQAVISHAVTKGLNPNAPMKPSGIEWLGDIPEHWEVKKLTYLFRLRSGDFISANNIEEIGTYPVYGGNGLRGYTMKNNLSGKYILIGRQGALCGNIKIANDDFWATEHALVVHPIKSYNLEWMSRTLHAMNLNQYSTAAAQPGLSVEQLSILHLPYPPKNEQDEISAFISETEFAVEKLTQKAKEAIELMQERRTALISAAVTGKIDVGDFEVEPNS